MSDTYGTIFTRLTTEQRAMLVVARTGAVAAWTPAALAMLVKEGLARPCGALTDDGAILAELAMC